MFIYTSIKENEKLIQFPTEIIFQNYYLIVLNLTMISFMNFLKILRG